LFIYLFIYDIWSLILQLHIIESWKLLGTYEIRVFGSWDEKKMVDGFILLLFRLVTTSARQSQDAWWGSTDWTEVEVGGIY
jgi:hypothetical protein